MRKATEEWEVITTGCYYVLDKMINNHADCYNKNELALDKKAFNSSSTTVRGHINTVSHYDSIYATAFLTETVPTPEEFSEYLKLAKNRFCNHIQKDYDSKINFLMQGGIAHGIMEASI